MDGKIRAKFTQIAYKNKAANILPNSINQHLTRILTLPESNIRNPLGHAQGILAS